MTIAAISRELHTSVENKLWARTCIRAPYLALESVAWTGGKFSAVAQSELPRSKYEPGPMRAAELFRHGANAGLCALAMSQADSARRHYLVSEARYYGCYNRVKHGSAVLFVARPESLGTRTARSTIRASDLASGAPLMDLSVNYLVLTESTFERLYRDQFQPTEQGQPLSLPAAKRIALGIRELSQVSPSLCSGHFHGFPVLPVSSALWELCDASSELLGKPNWVREASVQVRDLCWVGKPARFESTHSAESAADDDLNSRFDCRALSGERPFADVRLALSALF